MRRMLSRLVPLCLFLLTVAVCAGMSPILASRDEPIVIVLDAGHGGMDGGTDAGIRTEKEYNLLLAQYIKEALSADDRFTVYLTRSDDTYLKFLPRVLVAKEVHADLILSLHCNSNGASYVNGSMAYCSVVDRFDAGALADDLLDALADAVPIKRGEVDYVEDTGDALGVYYWNSERQWDMPGAKQLGMKSDYYSINTWASKFGIPSIIVEHGYLSNKNDAAVIDRDENLRAMANAQADAIIAYYTGHTHQFGLREVDYPSGCIFAGTSSRRCVTCGMRIETEALPADTAAHYWRQSASAATTCTSDGWKEFTCQISYNINDKGYACEVHSYRETYPSKGHQYRTITDTPAAHGADGLFLQMCQTCGHEVREVRPGEPHSYAVTETVEARCDMDGKIVHTCSICADSYTEVLPALGHRFVESRYTAPTATEDGVRVFTCEACKAEKEEFVSHCPHVYRTETIDPTCTADGLIRETCTVCGHIIDEAVPALGHIYVTQMDVAATCSADGFYKEKCTRCGDVTTENRPALPHDESLVEEHFDTLLFRCTVCDAERIEEIAHPVSKLMQNPIVWIVIAVLVIQLAVVAALFISHHRRKQAEQKKKSRFAEEESVKTKETPVLPGHKV